MRKFDLLQMSDLYNYSYCKAKRFLNSYYASPQAYDSSSNHKKHIELDWIYINGIGLVMDL